MSLDFDFTTTARDDLARLPSEASARFVAKFEDATDWTDHCLERLSRSPYYSLRTGKWRAVVDWDKTDDELLMLFADHRDKVYSRLP